LPDDNKLEQAEIPLEEELGQLRMKVTKLEGLLDQKGQEFKLKESRISELEQAVTLKDGEIASLEQSVLESTGTINQLNENLKQAVTSYKVQVVKANPDIPEELISGDSIEEITTSFESAKELVSKVRKGIEAEISSVKFPAGAPQRTSPDLSALSAREKIQYAIGGRR